EGERRDPPVEDGGPRSLDGAPPERGPAAERIEEEDRGGGKGRAGGPRRESAAGPPPGRERGEERRRPSGQGGEDFGLREEAQPRREAGSGEGPNGAAGPARAVEGEQREERERYSQRDVGDVRADPA